MSVDIVATFRVKPERVQEFEAIIAERVDKVRANEPGSQFYKAFRSQTEKNTHVVKEIGVDAQAFKAHQESDHVLPTIPKLEDVIDNFESLILNAV